METFIESMKQWSNSFYPIRGLVAPGGFAGLVDIRAHDTVCITKASAGMVHHELRSFETIVCT